MHTIEQGQKINKLAGLDHLRALAILLVFFFHYSAMFAHPAWLENIARVGWTGVDLFFVLSGYLIAGQLFQKVDSGKNISLKEFYTKRFFRIIPAYLLVVAVYFTLPSFHEKEALPPLWKFLSFTQNFGLNPKDYGTFSHAWSLCVEEQFYLLFPLVLLGMLYYKKGRWSVYFILGLFLLGFVCRAISWQQIAAPGGPTNFKLAWYSFIYYPSYNRLDGLLTGIGIAGLFQFYPAFRKAAAKRADLIFCAGLLLLTGAYFVDADPFGFTASVFAFPMVDLGFGCIVAAAVLPSHFLYRYPSRITTQVATLSYGIYLVHKMTTHLVQRGADALGWDAAGIPVLLLSILGAWLAAWLLRGAVEKPFLRLRDRVLKKNHLPVKSPLPATTT